MAIVRDALRAPRGGAFLERVLDWLPHAVILVDVAAAVAGMNERAGAMVIRADGLLVRNDVLRCRDPEDTATLHRMIGEMGDTDAARGATRACAIRIRRSHGRRALTAMVTLAERDGDRALVAVIVNDPEVSPVLDQQMLRTWYRLTPAEARVAGLVAAGLDVETIVGRLGVGANTVRTQLKSIFAKTDTGRQGELISLLLGNPTATFLSLQSAATLTAG